MVNRALFTTFSFESDPGLSIQLYNLFYSLVKSQNVLGNDSNAEAVLNFGPIGKKMVTGDTVLALPETTVPFVCMYT
jgi:hypothetical protein